MSSIDITIEQNQTIDCEKLCYIIQQLIVNQHTGPGERSLYISINDVINLPDSLPQLEITLS